MLDVKARNSFKLLVKLAEPYFVCTKTLHFLEKTMLKKVISILISSTALIPTVTLACGCSLYGEAVSKGWDEGNAAEGRQDWNSAIINYRRAASASQQIANTHLRACALEGSTARLRGAEAAKKFIQEGGLPSQARQVSFQAFEEFFANEGDKSLETTCP